MASAATMTGQQVAGVASGAHPATTFPNCHLILPRTAGAGTGRRSVPAAAYAPPQSVSALEQLRQAVREENWERHYETRDTKICMRAEWSATRERCSQLQYLASTIKAKRVLEIGSFCGVGALALAEALPEDGQVQVLELDPFVVSFGQQFQKKSLVGRKIKHMVGPARESLENLVNMAETDRLAAFDMVVVDADKEEMRHYFDTLWATPGLLSEGAMVCVDLTPFKGQVPTRYEKYGFPYRWQAKSGAEEIEALKVYVQRSEEFEAHELGSLLIVRKQA